MRELFQQYFNIAFLMGKPQDLPAGHDQLKLAVALSIVSYVLALAVPFGIERAFLQALLDIGCTGLVIWVALRVVGHPERFDQAFGGLCGASVFINLAALPLFALRPASQDLGGGASGTLADFVLLVWGLSLMAHVIRHTFETRMFFSVLLSVAYLVMLSTVMANIWPAPTVTVEPPEQMSNLNATPTISFQGFSVLQGKNAA